jgi:hypothetical protein
LIAMKPSSIRIGRQDFVKFIFPFWILLVPKFSYLFFSCFAWELFVRELKREAFSKWRYSFTSRWNLTPRTAWQTVTN